MSVSINGTGGITFADASTQSTGGYTGFRNRIINGAMGIDQRNAGASVTPTSGKYLVDRWQISCSQASKLSAQQNAGAVTPPSGFVNYLGITSTSEYSVTGNDWFQIAQIIEGYNIADLNWGTANAQPATLSFWVHSSLTGTFGGSIATTGSGVWVLPFTYAIASANTWTRITVAIPAGTSAPTNNNNTAGVFVRFGLGATGTSAGGTAGTWTNAGNYIQPSGTVSVVGTNGATFYITGVQLEKGSVATPFEFRPYGTELALCQRYYERVTSNGNGPALSAVMNGPNNVDAFLYWKVQKRTTPTVSGASGSGLVTGEIGSSSYTTNGFSGAFQMSDFGARVRAVSTTAQTSAAAGSFNFSSTSMWIDASAEL